MKVGMDYGEEGVWEHVWHGVEMSMDVHFILLYFSWHRIGVRGDRLSYGWEYGDVGYFSL